MQRAIEKELRTWKNSSPRYPLLLRGARQVGKTYIVEKFGEEFDSFEMVNFESQPEAIACFESLNPVEIIQKLELLTKRPIQPKKTLLFLDEIQACPKAILALRYFKEKMPEQHVIGAGSLLEFALNEAKFSFPVGRVQFIYLKPLSFQEFAQAVQGNLLENVTLKSGVPENLHQTYLHLVKEYFLVGGMPAVVNQFTNNRSFLETNRIQDLLLSTYRADFGKYASEAEKKYLKLLFDGVVHQIGHHFRYSEIDPHIKSRELKTALEQLRWAGLLYPIYASSASGIPLSAQMKRNKFKPLFIDIGLLERALQVDPHVILKQDLVQIHAGALAEQFVGQEWLAYADFFREEQLFFWEREKAGSSAEVDYVISIGSEIIPIEVKAGAHGHLKSIRQFMTEKKSPLGIRISQKPLEFRDNILSIPFYLLGQIPHLVREALS